MLFSGLVTALNLALALVIGVRLLLRARRPDAGPEAWLAVYFLCTAFLGALLSCSVYASLGDRGLDLSPAVTSAMLAVHRLLNLAGAAGILVFTWRTFHPGSRSVALRVGTALGVLVAAFAVEALTGRFEVVVLPGAAYWVERVVYTGGFVWMAWESLRYRGVLERRRRIGLADGLLCNRFLLWGIWACATAGLALSELVARLVYVWQSGETVRLVVEAAMPIIVVTIAVTSILGLVAAVALWLTFFPTAAYARLFATDGGDGASAQGASGST